MFHGDMGRDETDTTACDLCGRSVAAWEWDERWSGRATAEVFAPAMDLEQEGWLCVRCSHCSAHTSITKGGES